MFWPFRKKPPSEWLTVGCVSVRDYRGYTLIVSLCGLFHDGYTWEAVLNERQLVEDRSRRLSNRLAHFFETKNTHSIGSRSEAEQMAVEAVDREVNAKEQP